MNNIESIWKHTLWLLIGISTNLPRDAGKATNKKYTNAWIHKPQTFYDCEKILKENRKKETKPTAKI